MGVSPHAVHRPVLVNVAEFEARSRTNPRQLATEGVYCPLRQAFARWGIAWDACVQKDRGDGALVLVPPQVPRNRHAADLPVGLGNPGLPVGPTPLPRRGTLTFQLPHAAGYLQETGSAGLHEHAAAAAPPGDYLRGC